MKKLLNYWGDFAFWPFYLLVLFVPFFYDDAVALGLRIYGALFLFVSLILLIRKWIKKQHALRDWTYVMNGALAVLYLFGSYRVLREHGTPVDMLYPLEGLGVGDLYFTYFVASTRMMLRLFAETMLFVRIGIWLFKKWQAKRKPTEPPQE